MLRYVSYDIVFQEVPGEVTLAVNIAGCPNRCPGCHSPHLQEDMGDVLDERALAGLLEIYGTSVTCVCFMGGDGDPAGVVRLSLFVREAMDGGLRTAWYSGRASLPDGYSCRDFDYLKLGPYIASLGGLDSATTNQRFYEIADGRMIDRTALFRPGDRK